jgi:hypothetical protein
MALVKKMFGVNLKVMRLLGFYPSQEYRKSYKLYSYTVYCLFTTIIPVLASVHLITDPKVDLNKIADSAFIICQLGCFIIKMLPLINNADQIRSSIYIIEQPIFVAYSSKQEKIIEECIAICKRSSWFFLIFCIACVISWGITPFFDKEYKLPIDVWLPYDFKANLGLYLLSFVYIVAGEQSEI